MRPSPLSPAHSSPADAVDRFLHALRKPARILVAISGGSDSTGLLLLLHAALKDSRCAGVDLVAATVDHGLRAHSAQEAALVATLCHGLGIRHRTLRWDGDKPASGISAAAREARHRLLADAAEALGADLIVTGHTLNDQRETIAMRATRSADIDDIGLTGMAGATLYDRRTWMVRPLLTCERGDIRAALVAAGQGWIDDPSNEDRRFERTRTRQDLHDGALATPVGMTEAARLALSTDAARVIDRHADAFASTVVRMAPAIATEPPAAVRHALATLVMVLGGREHRPGGDAMDRLVALVHGQPTGRITLGRCYVSWRREGLFLLRERRGILPLPLAPGEAGIWDGRFAVTNEDTWPVVVEARAEADIAPDFAGLPADIARRATAVMARIRPESGQNPEPVPAPAPVGLKIVLGGHDRFLPRFDLPLADALARLFGRPAYPRPPV